MQSAPVESDTWLECALSWSASSGSFRYWWCLYYHNILEWAHHTQPVYLSEFVSSIKTCVQHVVVAIYSASAVDKDIDDFFLLSHDTKHSHK